MDNDPLYEQGLKHFGLGEWTQAAACFSQLQVNYPDEPRVTQFLETARLRAEATPGLQQGIQARTRASWLTRLSRVGVLLVILAVVGTVYLAYQNWVVPAQAENARLAHIDEMRRLAVTQLASGQYADAAQTYQQILNEVPGDVEANSGLARTQQLQQVADLYAQATQAMNEGDNAGATRLLEQISQLDPNYRDTNSLLGQIKSTQALIADYDSAMQLYDAKKWQAAAQAFETIRSTDRNFKPQEIVQYLYDSYVQLGEGR